MRRGLRDFKPQELANTAWAFATAGHKAPALGAARRDRRRGGATAARLRPDDPQALANIAWSFAKAAHRAPALLEAIARRRRCCGCATSTFKPQELANTAWSFATAGRPATAQKRLKNQVKLVLPLRFARMVALPLVLVHRTLGKNNGVSS